MLSAGPTVPVDLWGIPLHSPHMPLTSSAHRIGHDPIHLRAVVKMECCYTVSHGDTLTGLQSNSQLLMITALDRARSFADSPLLISNYPEKTWRGNSDAQENVFPGHAPRVSLCRCHRSSEHRRRDGNTALHSFNCKPANAASRAASQCAHLGPGASRRRRVCGGKTWNVSRGPKQGALKDISITSRQAGPYVVVTSPGDTNRCPAPCQHAPSWKSTGHTALRSTAGGTQRSQALIWQPGLLTARAES
ncbi:hypothetical protein EYF80_012815 [Liparis tanakae]|uniref:Uncharacterized protein n=1 Tax=Liparis tanakae TaxID=230148 RepID=A0A4Z2IG33_9TELE|nr:hypothetical protein EYF80_012815 [Liparis tanakae]